jgi:hypothetical protein
MEPDIKVDPLMKKQSWFGQNPKYSRTIIISLICVTVILIAIIISGLVYKFSYLPGVIEECEWRTDVYPLNGSSDDMVNRSWIGNTNNKLIIKSLLLESTTSNKCYINTDILKQLLVGKNEVNWFVMLMMHKKGVTKSIMDGMETLPQECRDARSMVVKITWASVTDKKYQKWLSENKDVVPLYVPDNFDSSTISPTR